MDHTQIKIFFQSTVNRLVTLCVVVFLLCNGVFGQQTISGFELYFFQNPAFKPWQLISYIFFHGSFSHLLFNMIALWSFGRVLESVWGARRFLIFFLACGVGAGALHLLVSYLQFDAIYQQLLSNGLTPLEITTMLETGRYSLQLIGGISKESITEFYTIYYSPAVGASGSIYGVLVAFAMLFPNFKVMLVLLPVPIAAKYFVPVLLLVDLLGGVTGVSIFGFNIAHFAHLGGALAGFFLMLYWKKTLAKA